MREYKLKMALSALFIAITLWANASDVESQLKKFEAANGRTQVAMANQVMDKFHEAEITDRTTHFGTDTPLDTMRMQVWYWAAEYFYAEQEYQQSVNYGERALPLTHGTDWEADCLSILSLAHFRLSEYDQAAHYAKLCYKLDEQTGDPDIMSSSLNTLAGIYVGANRPKEAEQYILRAIELAQKVDNPARMAVLQGMASEVYHQMGDDKQALTHAHIACEIEESRGDSYKLAVRRTQLASVLIGLHQYAEAEQVLGEAIPVFRQVGDRHSLGIALNKLGMSLLCQERQTEAIPHYREAESIFAGMGDLGNEMHAQRGLYESYWTLNPDSAKVALDRFDLLKDSLYSNATAESLARYNAEFGSDWLHKENEQLRSRTRKYVLIGMLLTLLLVGTTCWWMHRRMHLRESALQAIIRNLQSEGAKESLVKEGPDGELPESGHDFLSRLVSLVRRNMMQPEYSVESLASSMCITRGQLNRRVKALTGITTQQYVMRIRMEQARLLLSSRPDKPVSEIAYECGFSDPTSFSRAFRHTFGISPSQFRHK